MGQIVNLKCEKCGYEANLWLGAGIKYNNLEEVIVFFNKETQGKIRDAISANKDCFWTVRKEIGICDRCGKISSIAVFSITGADGQKIVYKAKCPCGGDVDITDIERDIFCPACGDKLEKTVTGQWD